MFFRVYVKITQKNAYLNIKLIIEFQQKQTFLN